MNEKSYLFNPFNIEQITQRQLQEMYHNVFNELKEEPSTMYEYSHNIEVYSNLNYIIGEIIARLTRNIVSLKTKIKIDTAKNTTEERKKWNKEEGKTPALAYFEALATEKSQHEINQLTDEECSLMRFKNAYNSMEEKINALKRKQDSIKFEEFNR